MAKVTVVLTPEEYSKCANATDFIVDAPNSQVFLGDVNSQIAVEFERRIKQAVLGDMALSDYVHVRVEIIVR